MAIASIQPSLNSGEISPSLYGRVDLAKWHAGLSTCRNLFINYRGGASSRAGTAYVGQCKQAGSGFPPRDIRFQFNVTQGYMLEWGDNYMRVKTDGAYVTEAPLNVTGASQANPAVLNIPGHNFFVGDWVFIQNVGGMTELNGRTFIVLAAPANAITIALTSGVAINSIGYSAYTSGGTVSRIYTLPTPYLAQDLPLLKFTQSADVMSLTLNNAPSGTEYPPYDLARLAADDWTLTQTSFAATISAPSACSAVPSTTTGSNPTQYAYVVTAVDETTGAESIASPIGTVTNSVDIAATLGSVTITWAPVAGAGSYNIYKAPTAYAAAVPIGSLFGYLGTSLGLQFVDTNITQDFVVTPPRHVNPFAQLAILSAPVTAQGSAYVQESTTATISSSTGTGAILTPVVVSGALVSIIIDSGGENYSNADTVVITDSGGGTGATAGLTIGPGTGTFPGVVAYFQQRRAYADTENNPDTYFMSRPGAFKNFDSSIPVSDGDAIIGTPWAQQVNGIQWLIPMPGGLIVATGLDAWQLSGNGGPGTPITPSQQNAQPQESNGFAPTVQPIKINYDILYVQTLGSVVRDLQYNVFTNIYAGTDITILSSHLFQGKKIVGWCWAKEPYKLIWAYLDDGTMLSLTYMKEQEVMGWSRHDTNGIIVSAASVIEPPVDAVYLIVKRYIQGEWVYYSERMNNRLWNNVEECWCVDCGLSLPMPTPNATLTASAASGAGVLFSASAPVFSAANIGDVIRVGGGVATVVAYNSSRQLIADITAPITETIQDDPNTTPLPVSAGNWTITTPVSSVAGLDHLEGKLVSIVADGSEVVQQPVVNGRIALSAPASQVTVGLPFQAQVQSLNLDVPAEAGTVQGRRKLIPAVTVRVEASRGFSVGANKPNAAVQPNNATVAWSNLIQWKQRGANNFAGTALPLFTGDCRVTIPGDWAKEGQVAVEQLRPFPLNISALIPEWVLGDTPGH